MAQVKKCDRCNRIATERIEQGYRKNDLNFCNSHFNQYIKMKELKIKEISE